ncbi:MAG: excinuclease ABC subunit UvrC, partial [Desulfocapsaceae bacterium]|nr:excinuclease ABC subunit UvrC [Desulfocapsaceae bacterium]
QMGQCLAPCSGLANHDEYMDNVAKVLMVLEGRSKDLIASLKKQMEEHAAGLNFEKAARKRDQIKALSKTLEKQVVASRYIRDQDIFGFARKDTSVAVAALTLRDGLISGSRNYFLADPYGEDASILAQILNQYYFHGDNVPKEVILPFDVNDSPLLEERLADLRQAKVKIIIPKQGERADLLRMALRNAEQVFEDKEKKEQTWAGLAAACVKKLKLTDKPAVIECLDISNIQGKIAVGSLVCFDSGEPATQRYRHYKIRTLDTPDDYAMMAEVLRRRFTSGLEKDDLPDLFMVDGGKGQLAMALRIAGEFGIQDSLDWLGIAKERAEEGEKLYKPKRKNPIILLPHDPVLLYMMRIRDEAHRFGITFHRKLRNKTTLASELDNIEGIGPTRKKRLLRSLGSLKNIKNATVEQLSSVTGIGPEIGTEIYRHFHQEE